MRKDTMQRGSGTLLLIFLVIAAVILAGVYYYVNNIINEELTGNADTLVMPPAGDVRRVAMPEVLFVPMNEQNSSKQNGMAKISAQDGKVVVEISVANGPKDIPQPAHIHLGSCEELGDVKKPLTSLVSGSSRTTIEDMSLADMINGLPLAINVHQSSEKVGVYVSCGDVITPTPEESSMMRVGQFYEWHDTAMCARIEHACLSGYEPFSDESGCGCQLKTGEGTAGSMMPLSEVPTPSAETKVRTVDVTAKDFEFSTREIRVKKGEHVTLNLKSTKGFHDWVVDGLARTERVNTDESTSTVFTPDKTGTFEFYCSVGSHRQMGMKGLFIVE